MRHWCWRSFASVSIRVHPWLKSLWPFPFPFSPLSCHIPGVQRRRLIILLLGCVLLVGTVVLAWPRNREPDYGGRKLSDWLLAYGSSSIPPETAEAAEAIRHIGTNALPWLMIWRNYQMPSWKGNLAAVLERGPLTGTYTRAVGRSLARQQNLAAQTLVGFQVLGRQASPAIPELKALLKDEPSSVWAMQALANIGEPALPALLAALVDPQTANRDNLPRYFGSMRRSGHDISAAVPVLAQCLNDPNAEVAAAAAVSLAMTAREPGSRGPFFKANPAAFERVMPALAGSLKDPRPAVRVASVRAIAVFREQALPALPALTNALSDPDVTVRLAATNALQRIAPEVLGSAAQGQRRYGVQEIPLPQRREYGRGDRNHTNPTVSSPP